MSCHVGCFWTDFEETYEVCDEEVAGDLTWWPIDNTEWDVNFNGTGVVIFGVVGSPEVRTGFDGAVHVTPPVTEGWAYYGLFGFPTWQSLAIARIPGELASSLSWSFTHVSGLVRSFRVAATSGEYVLFEFEEMGDEPMSSTSVYDFESAAGVLQLSLSTDFTPT